MRRVATIVAPALFVEGMLYAALAPLLPHYVDELGLSTTAAGVLTASFAVGNLVFGLPGGALAARLGGRRTLLIGLGGLMAASVVFAFGRDVLLLDAARFVQGAGGSVLWAGGLTWASDTATADRRGTVIGTLLGVGIAGAPFGPLLGGLAVATSPTLVFLALAVAMVPLAAIIATAAEAPRPRDAHPSLRGAVRPEHRRRTARAFVLTLIPSIGFGLLFVLSPLRLAAAGASAGAIALTFILASAIEAGANPLSGRIADRRGTRRLLLASFLGTSAAFAIFALPLGAVGLALTTMAVLGCFGLGWVPLTIGLGDAMRRSGVDEGHAFALFNMAWAGGQAIGASGGAALAELFGAALPSLLTCALIGACALTQIRTRGGTTT
ncbi:MAG: MFS transporter [Actinobacteria bacterium]|nr:MFS transporter [Actinomycetota bacterium]